MPLPESDKDRAPCLNCGASRAGAFCHECGQEARSLEAPFRDMVHDWLGGALGFDARLWRTLRRLVLEPGELSLDYLAGRRARYVPPLRLYFIVSVVFFLTLAWSGLDLVHTDGQEGDGAQIGITFDPGNAAEDPPSEEGTAPTASAAESGPRELFLKKLKYQVTEDPDGLTAAFQRHLAQAVFFLVPAFALFSYLLFRRRYRAFLQHLVVSVHVHTAAFLLIAAGTALDTLFRLEPDGPFGNLGTFLALCCAFATLRRVFGEGTGRTLLKTLPLAVLHLLATSVVMLITLVAAILMG